MRVLDANFLIDYLNGDQDTEAYYQANGADEQQWVVPGPTYAEVLVGVGNYPTGDVGHAIEALRWVEIYDVDEELAEEAAHIAEEIGSQGPYLDGVDALVAAVGRVLDAPVVSADNDLTHEVTRQVVNIEEYRR